jgi:hypothetical protein
LKRNAAAPSRPKIGPVSRSQMSPKSPVTISTSWPQSRAASLAAA